MRRAWTPSASLCSQERWGDNLYKLWNRMTREATSRARCGRWRYRKTMGQGSGSLGVPNVADRVAQTAAAMLLEEKLEPIFHPDSYGYRPGRSGPGCAGRWPSALLGARLGDRSRHPGVLRQRPP